VIILKAILPVLTNPEPIQKSKTVDPATPRFLRACHGLPVDTTPVWFMRQAGRYMPEYRAIREKHTLLEIVQQPQLAAEVTLQPVHKLGVDAAILFADILLPVVPMGLPLEFVKGEGPSISPPIRNIKDIQGLRRLDAESDLGYVMEAVRLVRRELESENIPLIGFAGAPFTVASYMIEGGPSRSYRNTKGLMHAQPEAWEMLLRLLADSLANYLIAQVEAGAQAVQLFDSWVGNLNPLDYLRYVLPYTQSVIQQVEASGVPVIHFGTDTAALLPLFRKAGGSVIGLDWRINLDAGWSAIGPDFAVQGNLDPVALFDPIPVLHGQVIDVLKLAGGRPGHIFNLGHGILPETPVDHVKAVVDIVHEYSANA
jgi:uroporphyrinogen decarboxylase